MCCGSGGRLRISWRNEYLATGGVAGVPVIRIGACLRVPRWALIELANTGHVVRLFDECDEAAAGGASGAR